MNRIGGKLIPSVIDRLEKKYQHLAGIKTIHFIHIGKTGGTAVKYALKEYYRYGKFVIIPHSHSFKLSNAPIGEMVMFFLRDPVKRFTSGFYSRQRQGLPRIYSPWTDEEKLAFEYFSDPDQLATSLVSEDQHVREKAYFAMKSIRHVNSHYWDWFGSEDYFLSRSADIFFIGFQESLESDFDKLKLKLGLPETVKLPDDPVIMHKNPVTNAVLSTEAIQIMKEWYRIDYEFIGFCREFIKNQLDTENNPVL